MIENLSIWAKTIVLSAIIVSILEMLLPNNKTKKYVKMVMGIFVLYSIISPLINDKKSLSFDVEDLNINKTISNEDNLVINQESMDKRIEELYIQEIEKDIKKKVEKKGYTVKSCKVKAKFTGDENQMGINKIVLKIEKNSNETQEDNLEEDDKNEDNIENKVITEIQKIKKVDTKMTENNKKTESTSLEKQDIQNLKKFLIEEYEVSEKCLEIN